MSRKLKSFGTTYTLTWRLSGLCTKHDSGLYYTCHVALLLISRVTVGDFNTSQVLLTDTSVHFDVIRDVYV